VSDGPGIGQDRALARQCFNRGNFAAAEVICRNILDVIPTDAEALQLLGMIAIRIGMRDHAEQYLSSALSFNPANSAARDQLAVLKAERPLLASTGQGASQLSMTANRSMKPISAADASLPFMPAAPIRADRFFGNGRSSVAAFIALLKDWNPGDCILGAPSQLMQRNLFIHLVRP
jgi:tetratricopeptide (TPR) repeat protein